MIYAFCASVILAIIFSSVVAGNKFPTAARLPMQWGLNGKPTWSAPRTAALTFTPVLAIIVTGFLIVVAGAATHIAAIVVILFFAAHLLHLWLVYRHLMQP
ncbi:hypothetical protein [Sulfitobacter sp. 20_GPM-1509m]|uniref:hypothetical protein n=1 Tax=Sulfitobacter sp. 20_GPM-1509m TaxID=1380367 RepID=UPI00048ED1F0|nr:hypothetical protein [Sulfitobacter sp. 20_GPM-1509m]